VRNCLLAGALKRGRILCFLGGRRNIEKLYLGSTPVCQGRVAGFFGFLPVFFGNWYMYFRAFGEMLWLEFQNITMDCGVDADWTKLKPRLS